MGVAQSGIHALSRERRCQVCRVSHEQYAPLPEALGDAGMKGVDGLAQHVALVIAAERLQQACQEIRGENLLSIFPRQNHEFVTPAAIGCRNADCGADAAAEEFRKQRTVGIVTHVYDDPVLPIGVAAQRDAQALTDRASAAVAGKHPLCCNSIALPVRSLDGHHRAVGNRFHIHDVG